MEVVSKKSFNERFKNIDFKSEYIFNKKAFIAFATLCTLIILVSIVKFENRNLFISNESSHINNVVLPSITQGVKIEQDLYIHENYNGGSIYVEILFGTYNRVNDSDIRLTLAQDGEVSVLEINATQLVDNQYHSFEFNNKNFHSGDITLSIEGLNGVPEKSASVYVTEDLVNGTLKFNGEDTGKSAVINLKYNTIIDQFTYKYVYLGMFVITMLLLVLLTHYKNDFYIFAYSMTIIITILSVVQPMLSYSAEPFCELGTNFFYNAYHENLATNLVALDAGYLPLYQRLWAIFAGKLLHLTKYFVVVTQYIAIANIGLFYSVFSLKNFRKILKSDLGRFLICILPAVFGIVTYEMTLYYNFIYTFSVVGFLILFVELDKLCNKKYIGLLIFVSIGIFSKIMLAIFIVPYILFAILKGCKKDYKSSFFYVVLSLVIFLQLLITRSSRSESLFRVDIKELVFSSIENMYKTYEYILSGNIPQGKDSQNEVYMIFILLGILAFCYYLFKKKRYNTIKAIFWSNVLAFGSLLTKGIFVGAAEYGIVLGRHYYVAQIMVAFTCFIVIFTIVEILRERKFFETDFSKNMAMIIVFVVYLVSFTRHYSFRNVVNDYNSVSQWEIQSELVNDNAYYIKILPKIDGNPNAWEVRKNVYAVFEDYREIPVNTYLLNTEQQNKQMYGFIIDKTNLGYNLGNEMNIEFKTVNGEVLSVDDYKVYGHDGYTSSQIVFNSPQTIESISVYGENGNKIYPKVSIYKLFYENY